MITDQLFLLPYGKKIPAQRFAHRYLPFFSI